VTSIPWTYEPRPDTGTTNVRLGIWLFLASEVMLFGSLFSAYVLLRTGSLPTVAAAANVVTLPSPLAATAILVVSTTLLAFGGAIGARTRLAISTLLFATFVYLKIADYRHLIADGYTPARDVLLACWFTVTGAHLLHVVGGMAANVWVLAGLERDGERDRARLHVLRLYWYFVDLVWFAILVSFYLV
jgi:heme/copper-type cytochrome/quinol oxidase subunit 3